MSFIDPKGSRQEPHRAQNLPDSPPALAAQPPPLIVLPIPGFWKPPARQIHTVSPKNDVQALGK